jgi:quercetin dioxygenase-like cupin family protein
MFVLEGEVVCADGSVLKAGYYAFIPPGYVHGFAASTVGALIYVAFGPSV